MGHLLVRGVSEGYDCRPFPREGEYIVSFNKDIICEFLLTTSPEQDGQTANDPESAQRDWKHIAVIPVSDSLPH